MENQKILLRKIERIHNVDCVAYPNAIYLGRDEEGTIIVPIKDDGKIVYENGEEKEFTLRINFKDGYPSICDLIGETVYFAGVPCKVVSYDETIHEIKKE